MRRHCELLGPLSSEMNEFMDKGVVSKREAKFITCNVTKLSPCKRGPESLFCPVRQHLHRVWGLGHEHLGGQGGALFSLAHEKNKIV